MRNRMNKRFFILIVCISILSTKISAFTIAINSEAKLKYLKIFERNLTPPTILDVGINKVELENYPNAVYLMKHKSSSNFEMLGMIWVASDTSQIELQIDEDYEISFERNNAFQDELDKIFSESNTWSLFPYKPEANKPLEPILALEAKAIIQNVKVYTKRSILNNLMNLSIERGINNWSTKVLAAYLEKPFNSYYDNGSLIKLHGFDSLENKIEINLNNEKNLFVIISGSWCGPCIKGIPKLRNLYEEVKTDVEFVTLWNDSDLRQFTSNHRDKKQIIAWSSLWDKYGLMANALEAKSYPTYILFDKAGKEIRRWDKTPSKLPEVY